MSRCKQQLDLIVLRRNHACLRGPFHRGADRERQGVQGVDVLDQLVGDVGLEEPVHVQRAGLVPGGAPARRRRPVETRQGPAVMRHRGSGMALHQAPARAVFQLGVAFISPFGSIATRTRSASNAGFCGGMGSSRATSMGRSAVLRRLGAACRVEQPCLRLPTSRPWCPGRPARLAGARRLRGNATRRDLLGAREPPSAIVRSGGAAAARPARFRPASGTRGARAHRRPGGGESVSSCICSGGAAPPQRP